MKEDVLPPIYRRLTTEATANLKLRFFGDDRAAGKGRIPGLSGTLTRSASFAGNPVSAGLGDSDKDGYTNVEEYLNGTNPKESIDYRNLGNNVDTISG